MPDFSQSPWPEVLGVVRDPILPILVVAVAAVVLARAARVFIHGIVKALMDREATEGTAQQLSALEVKKRMDTLDELGTNVLRSLIVIIAGLMILGQAEFDIGPAVAGLGIIGVAVGFGAQHLVKDYLNGALILIENQFSIGDVVRVAGVAGVVEDFSLRRTTLRDLDGNVHTVPNGEIAVASNLTRVWGRVNEDITVGYGSDLDRIVELVDQVGAAMAADEAWRRRILEPPKVERVERLADSGIVLKVLATVGAADRWAVAGELRKRLLTAFAAEGVEIPFPHRVIVTRSEPGGEDDAGPPAEGDASVD